MKNIINVKLNSPRDRQGNFQRFLNEAAKYKPLTPEQEKTATPEQLVKHNMLFASSVACRYDTKGIDVMDILQEALIGMTIAAERFKPENGNKFISYAVWWMQQKITSYIDCNINNVKYPELISRAKYRIEKNGMQELDIEEISEKLKLSKYYISQALGMKSEVSLDEKYDDGDDVYQVSGSYNADVSVNKIMQSERLTELLKGLNENERKVIEMRFLGDYKMDTYVVGEHIGYSHQHVCNIERKALSKIKENYEKQRRPEYAV